MQNTAQNTYLNTSVTTASPGELTLLLYNGCYRFLKLAIRSIQEKNINGKHTNLIRAQDIIIELQSTLDMNYEISNNLFTLYDYMMRKLEEANIKQDIQAIEECAGLIAELRDTWAEALKSARSEQKVSGG
ncbi:flagellar export chaperone FliS [Cohnella terricola]|uniref:Flagellar secretion chaperone FliS n=1 Tax=Cohnella terricola TaxID=1289167 RepID=A0A559J890_9BACL|nr:flagellar export chaperone FliS [Cohnella terricola]TVX96103.1 flagellar export chaperone FliS [Cohnella terricola]